MCSLRLLILHNYKHLWIVSESDRATSTWIGRSIMKVNCRTLTTGSFGKFAPIVIVRISSFNTPPERSAAPFCTLCIRCWRLYPLKLTSGFGRWIISSLSSSATFGWMFGDWAFRTNIWKQLFSFSLSGLTDNSSKRIGPILRLIWAWHIAKAQLEVFLWL
jgi:hypothetical protein